MAHSRDRKGSTGIFNLNDTITVHGIGMRIGIHNRTADSAHQYTDTE